MSHRNCTDPSLSTDLSTKRVNLHDIAHAMEVSVMTVSRALRNEPGVSQFLREKIQEKARQMGYEPDPALAALQHYRRTKSAHSITATIAWLNAWPEPNRLRGIRDFDLYWKGAQEMAEHFGYRLEEFDISRQYHPERIQSILEARSIQAVLIPPHSFLDADWSGFNWDHFSAVRLGSGVNLEIHCVTSDQVGNTIMACDKIRQRGYHRIGFVGPDQPERLFGAGFLWAQAHLPEAERLPSFLYRGAFEESAGEFSAWLRETRPDAIFGELGAVYEPLRSAGYNIPGDLGLASTSIFDKDTRIDAGIDQHPEEIGRVAVQTLIALIHDHDRGLPSVPRKTLVKGQWVDGLSLPQRG